MTPDFKDYEDFEGPSKIRIQPGPNKVQLTVYRVDSMKNMDIKVIIVLLSEQTIYYTQLI